MIISPREEMAVMLMRAYEVKNGKNAISFAELSFTDKVDISTWAKSPIQTAVKLGLLEGVGNNLFAPQGKATRAESAKVIYNLLGE